MDKIEELLTRGVDKIYPTKEVLEKELKTEKKLKLYLGVDPTGEKIHIGHMVALQKLRQFQKAGHHVILLIGDFTGMIGDPTDKLAARKKLTRDEVLQNAKTYKQQAEKVLDFSGENPVEIKFNSDWLAKLTFAQVIELACHFTAQQMLERDMYQKRIKENKPIYLHEFFYPLMQGYDSVVMDVDLEIGGTDQTFNMLAGRTLMKMLKNKEKFVLTVPLLTDANDVKIGKTTGNVIALTAKPNDFYGMIMNLPDEIIIKCFELITEVPMEEIKKIEQALKNGENPMIYKKKLAFELTRFLNDEKQAQEAQTNFENTFQKRNAPVDIPEISITDENMGIVDLLVTANLAGSNSQAKTLITQNAVEIDGKIVNNPQEKITVKSGIIIKVGKHRFAKIK